MYTIRYYTAILLLAVGPPSILYWFSIHPFIRFWRAVGPRLTLGIHYAGFVLLAVLIALNCRFLLSVDYGTNPILIGLAVPSFAAAVLLKKRLSAQLRFRILTGMPELASIAGGGRLLTEGIYARMRHPRYVQIVLSILSYALFCNFLATYLLVPIAAILLGFVIWMEERELRDRFGAEYEAYCARVPRFIPKFGRS